MTAVALPDLDLAHLRAAVERLDLPNVDLSRFDFDWIDLDTARRDLGRLRATLEGDLAHLDLGKLDPRHLDQARHELARLDLHRVEVPHVDLPALADLPGVQDLEALFRRRRAPLFPASSWLVAGLALLGGVALGGLVAFFLHPSKGARRRRAALRRLGRLKRPRS